MPTKKGGPSKKVAPKEAPTPVKKKTAGKAATPAKKPPEPAAKKAAAPAKKAETKTRPAKSKRQAVSTEKGDKLYCTVCGIVVTVDEECGCEACDIICCGEQMQAKR